MKSKILIVISVMISAVVASHFFGVFTKEDKIEKTAKISTWWEQVEPDVLIGDLEYYASRCAIIQVTRKAGVVSEKTVFKIKSSSFSSCKNRSNPLTYDGKHLIFSVCEMAFGAGGCGRGRYRSADMTLWQEDIGITWIKGEQYEAWRNLGSTSSKADSVKKIEN